MPKRDNRPGRMLHIRVSEELHKKMRIQVAELDTTLQNWVVNTIAKELGPQRKAYKPA